MDIVYTFINGKNLDNTELKHSLRSVRQHLTGVDNIYVIGANPHIDNVIHINFKDIFSPARNITKKLLLAANHPDISEDFMYIADDHYLMKNFKAEEYPVYINGTLRDLCRTQRNTYKSILANTINALELKGYTSLNYNLHCPVIYNKTKLRQLSSMYDLNNRLGYVLKSLYFNTFPPDKSITETDCKIRTNFKPEEMRLRIGERSFWSSGKEKHCPNIEKLLRTLYA